MGYDDGAKEQFIHWYSKLQNSREHVRKVLKKMEPFEIAWGMDYSLQDVPQLEHAVNEVIGTRIQSAENTLIILRDYVKWREHNLYPVSDSIYWIKLDIVRQMRENMVGSPKHLKNVLKYVFDDPRQHTSDCIYRAFLWLGYMGVDSSDTIRITTDDVDMDNMVISCGNESFKIYEESKQDFLSAVTLTEFEDNKHRKDGIVLHRVIKRKDGNEILRGMINSRRQELSEDYLNSTIRTVITKKFRIASEKRDMALSKAIESGCNPEKICSMHFNLTFKDVYLSGLFYRMYESEMRDGIVDFYPDAQRTMERKESRGMEYKESEHSGRQKMLARTVRDLSTNYTFWKEAFYDK